MALEVRPITRREVHEFIDMHHRHHRPPQGFKYAIAVYAGEKLVGVATVGRPVAREFDDNSTAEVTRCCTDGTRNVASMLYGAARGMAKANGYKRLITYTLKEESGTSLKAAGFVATGWIPGKSWNVPSRARVDKHALCARVRWEIKFS